MDRNNRKCSGVLTMNYSDDVNPFFLKTRYRFLLALTLYVPTAGKEDHSLSENLSHCAIQGWQKKIELEHFW